MTKLVLQEDYEASYVAEPTVAQFHMSEAFIRGIRGPVGSGKSVGCVMEMVRRAHEQEPDKRRRRKTRWACIRNTYAELKTTTLATWLQWVPEDVAPLNRGEPMTVKMVMALPDNTILDMEVLFISCDKPADVGKLKSLDLTGVWLNEASEMDKLILDMASSRVGRYPSLKDGAPATWCGVIMDTNSMDDDHWWYVMAEGSDDEEEREAVKKMLDKLREQLLELGIDRPLVEFWQQPPALLEADGSFVPNPEAENVKNHSQGYGYWLMMAAGKAKEWTDIYILNKYGKVIDGKPCYPEYDDNYHFRNLELRPIPGMPIEIGADFGLSPAAVFGQVNTAGRLNLLGECVAQERSMGAWRFWSEAVKVYIQHRFGDKDSDGNPWRYKVRGDPAGDKRSENDEVHGFEIVRKAGFEIEAARTNNFGERRDSVASFLLKRDGIAIDRTCVLIRKGFRGGYHYRRIQVGGEARYQDEAYKNKYSHPHDALQYLALPYASIGVPRDKNPTPDWAKRLKMRTAVPGADRPWTRRGGR